MVLPNEDVSANPYFQYLKRQQADIYGMCARKQWIVLVPHSHTLHKAVLDEEFVRTHVLQQSPLFVEQFVTLNGRCVNLEGKRVSPKTGFSEASREVEVLFEETFYDENFRSFRVLLVSAPLIGEIGDLGDGRHSAKKKLCDIPAEQRTVADHSALIDMLLDSQTTLEVFRALDVFCVEFNKSYVMVKGFTKFAAQKIQKACEESIDVVFDSCDLSDDEIEQLRIAVECYLMYALHSKIFGELTVLYVDDEKVFSAMLSSLVKSISLRSLGIRHEIMPSAEGIQRAVKELASVNERRTPLEKLACIKCTSDLINDAVDEGITERRKKSAATLGSAPGFKPSVDDLAVTTDDLLPLFVFVVVHANLPFLKANLEYIQHFHASNPLTSHLGYCLANAQAAVEFITGGQLEVTMRRHEHKQPKQRRPLHSRVRYSSATLPSPMRRVQSARNWDTKDSRSNKDVGEKTDRKAKPANTLRNLRYRTAAQKNTLYGSMDYESVRSDSSLWDESSSSACSAPGNHRRNRSSVHPHTSGVVPHEEPGEVVDTPLGRLPQSSSPVLQPSATPTHRSTSSRPPQVISLDSPATLEPAINPGMDKKSDLGDFLERLRLTDDTVVMSAGARSGR